MKKILLFLASAALVVSCAKEVDPRENFHIYLCFGQSNMAGAGTIEAQDTTCSERLKMMATVDYTTSDRKIGNWYPGTPPLCHDLSADGLSLADYFGRTMVEKMPEEVTVGLISVAIEGCDIRLFDKDIYADYTNTYGDWFEARIKAYGGNPYARLVEVAKKAQQDGTIKGILLHQGETNNGQKEWIDYVKKIYGDLLRDLNLKAEDVPLLAGEVAPESVGGKCALINPIIDSLPSVVPSTYAISAEGIDVRDDSVHFSTVGVRQYGERYAEKMIEVKGF